MVNESDSWSEARAYREEYERLRTATEHLGRASAELMRAAAAVGDHASALGLREAVESVQLLQSQLATAAEKAFSLGQFAVRRAQHETLQRRANEAVAPTDLGLDLESDT
jgi:FtsZ-binding cell division protein ZapB